MSDDDDWEFTALEKDKRTAPGLVINVCEKSYADAVLQQCNKVDIIKESNSIAIPHNIVSEKPTFMKLRQERKHESKRQQKRVKKEEKFVGGILKRENTPVISGMGRKSFNTLAEDFALSEACMEMITDMDNIRNERLPYTWSFENNL